jgi:aryl-alcohol dehydrogenase-like predicted oxidoreductase
MKITRKHFLRSLLGITASGLGLRHTAWTAETAGALALKDLGKTGLRVTALGLGATRTMEPALIRAALDQGINFIDTGRSYLNGKNEEMLGGALQGKRQQVVIQSKIRLPEGSSGAVAAKEAEAYLEKELHESLKSLRTDRVDVMLLHGVETEPELDDPTVREFFVKAKQAGKIRRCGFSSHRNHVALLEKAVQSAFYDVVLLPFNPFGRFRHSIGGWPAEWDQERLIQVMDRAQAAGIGIVAMKTCSAGPYALKQGDAPSLAGAVRWVTDHACIASAVPAIANFTQLEEHLAMHRA